VGHEAGHQTSGERGSHGVGLAFAVGNAKDDLDRGQLLPGYADDALAQRADHFPAVVVDEYPGDLSDDPGAPDTLPGLGLYRIEDG
jgi:hypothetical protein